MPKKSEKNTKVENTSTTVEVAAPTVEIEAPKAIVTALGNCFNAQEKTRVSYVDLAKKTRGFGKESTLKDGDVRTAIAKALAASKGIELEKVLSTPAKGGDSVLYPLLSKLTAIARPKTKDKAQAVDAELENPETNWQAICDAASKKAREGNPTDGVDADKEGAAPFTEENLTNGIIVLVTKAQVAQMPIQRVFSLITAALVESLRAAYPGESFDTTIAAE